MTAPEHLSDDAKSIWDATVAACGTQVEGPSLEAYATQVARMRDAQARIDKDGLVVADEKGRPVPHPAIAIERAAAAEVRIWAPQFKPRRTAR